jgi:hypothetical protein
MLALRRVECGEADVDGGEGCTGTSNDDDDDQGEEDVEDVPGDGV